MDPRYGRVYRELYDRHWWWRARERLILERLRRLRPDGRWGRILDVGCGDGLFFGPLSRLGEVEGVEPDERLVSDDGPWRERIHVVRFDADFDPGHRFGLILFLDVLEHMDEPGAALRHAAALLEPDGVILATVPASMLLWSGHDVLNEHRTRYDRRRLLRLAREAGLRVEACRHFFHWAYPAKLLARLAESALRREPRPARVPPSPINAALYGLSRLEQETLGRLRPPFGSSLLLVARPAQPRPQRAGPTDSQ